MNRRPRRCSSTASSTNGRRAGARWSRRSSGGWLAAWRSSAPSRPAGTPAAPSWPRGRGRARPCSSRFPKSSRASLAPRTTTSPTFSPQCERTSARSVESLLERLLATLRTRRPSCGSDPRTRRRHPGERIIAFCHYAAETVGALWSTLGRDAGVAALTASGARVAGGRVSRASVLEQLRASRRRRPRDAARRADRLAHHHGRAE